MMAASAHADSWSYWGQVNTPVTNSGSAGAQMTADGTNFYYATLVDGIWRASFADPGHSFAEMPMTGFPLWDANTNTNGFAVWSIAFAPHGTLVIAGSSVNIVSGVLNYTPNSGFTNTLPVFYWWDATNQLWRAASVSGKSYPYTAIVGNFATAVDGALWTCSGFSPYAYRSTDDGHSYAALDIDAGVPTNYFPMPLSGAGSFGDIFSVAAGPNNLIVIGTETGGYLQTSNNGQTWLSLDPNFTNANSVNPLGRIGNATVTGLDRYGDFLCDNIEFVASFPGLAAWTGVTLIGYRPADGSYFNATGGFPANYSPLSIATPPSGNSFTFVNQLPSLLFGIYRSPDGQHWTQFNTNIPALNMATGRGLGIHTATLSNLVFVSVNGAIYDDDTTPPPVTNRPPVAEAHNISVLESTPTNFSLTGHDADGNALSFMVTAQPAHGSLSGAGSNLVYTPFANFTGIDTLLYVADDGTVASSPTVVNFAVNAPANPPPSISFSSPVNGNCFLAPASVSLSAEGSGIQQVSFYNGTNILATMVNPPYVFTWTNPAVNDYTLNALAISASEAYSWAQPVTISILPANPVLNIRQMEADDITLTWPVELENIYVETAASAGGPWKLLSDPQLYFLTGQAVTVGVTNSQFFRLMHPR